MREVMLTTVDNPVNPFDDFNQWYQIDMLKGYNTSALLARLVPTCDSLPESYMERIKEEVIDRWVAMQPLTYKKVVREVEEPDYDAIVKAEEEYSDTIPDNEIDEDNQ